jgi:hypothetical protein
MSTGPITVRELRNILEHAPDDAVVMVSTTATRNGACDSCGCPTGGHYIDDMYDPLCGTVRTHGEFQNFNDNVITVKTAKGNGSACLASLGWTGSYELINQQGWQQCTMGGSAHSASSSPSSKSQGRALIAIQHGEIACLFRLASTWIEEYIEALGEDHAWEEAQGNCRDGIPDGIWVRELELADAGPSDWIPELRDAELRIDAYRAPTPDEWRLYVADEPVWAESILRES